MTKKLAWWVGGILVILGLLGYVSNPLVGANGLFVTDNVHNWFFLITGVLAILAALSGEKMIKLFFQVFGVIYAIVTVVGFFSPTAFGLNLNMADNVLHLVIAVVLLWVGFGKSKQGTMMTPKSDMPASTPGM